MSGNSAIAPPNRRLELIRAARDVFAEKGFGAAGIRDIAERAGIGTAALYHHVESKQQLLLEVMLHVQSPTSSVLERAMSCPGGIVEKLEELGRAHVARIGADPIGTTLLFTEVDALTEEQRAPVIAGWNTYRYAVQDLIRDGQAEGSIRPDGDPRLLSMALLGSLNWTHRWLRADGRLSPEELGGRLVRQLISGFAAPGQKVEADDEPQVIRAADAGRLRAGREGEILGAAIDLFRRQGYDSTTTAEIAAVAGVHSAAIYQHFESKEQLLYTIVRDVQVAAGLTFARLTGMPGADPLASWRAALRFHASFVLDNLARTSLLFGMQRSLNDAHRKSFNDFDRELTAGAAGLIARGEERGKLVLEAPPSIAARGAFGSLNWTHTWFDPAEAWGPEEVASGLTDIVVYGIAPRDGRAPLA